MTSVEYDMGEKVKIPTQLINSLHGILQPNIELLW